MAEIKNLLLLGADALLYFVVLASLLRARTRKSDLVRFSARWE